MSLNLNPLAINGPGWAGNAQQADYRVPNSAVASYAVGSNPLSYPIAAYVQPGQTAPALLPNQLDGGPLGISNNP
jgi:hypothetical protein